MVKIILIRHGLNDLVGKRLAGQLSGVHLNEEGKIQAQKLAEGLKEYNITALYSSPLERALETAEPIACMLNLEYIINEAFTEVYFGIWTNFEIEELKKDVKFHYFNSFRSGTRIPDGELAIEAQQRIISGIEKINAQYKNETVAIVCHSDLIKLAIAYFAGIHTDMMHRIEISPASISIIELFEDTAIISLVNRTFY